MDITPVHLSDFQKDFHHILVLLELRISQIRDFFFMIVHKLEVSNLCDIKVKLEQQPIIVCLKNVAEIIAYLGRLWLKSVLI